MPERRQLIRQLSEHLAARMRSGDPAALLDAQAARLIDDLAKIMMQDAPPGEPDTSVDVVTAIGLLVEAYWTRYQIPPQHQRQGDLQACRKWASALLPIAPELIPELMRIYIFGPITVVGVPAAVANYRGVSLYTEYKRTGDFQTLQGAILHFRGALIVTEADHPNRAMYLTNFGNTLRARFERTGQLSDLDEAITAASTAVEITPDDDPIHRDYLGNLGIALRARFERTGQLSDLDEAITAASTALDATPAHHPDRAIRLSNFGNALMTRFGRTGQLADLDRGITLLSDAAGIPPADRPERPSMLSNLGNALRIRFERTGQIADLDLAAAMLSDAVESSPIGQPDRPMYLFNWSVALRLRFERTGLLAHLDEAIAATRQVLGATSPDHPQRPGRLYSLSVALRERFERIGLLADLDEAITTAETSLDMTPAGHPVRPATLTSLGNALAARYERTGELADLERAITLLSEAAASTPAGYPDRAVSLTDLGSALTARFDRTGQLVDLDRAIDVLSDAADATPTDHPGRAGRLSNLGNALHVRFSRMGELVDLDRAIDALSEAIEGTPDDYFDRTKTLSNLGNALRTRFERTEHATDLDRAIAATREALDNTPTDHPERPGRLFNLSVALLTQFGRTGSLADLDEAIDAGKKVLDDTPADRPNWPLALSSLGNALRLRFGSTSELADLDRAIIMLSDAAKAGPLDHPNRIIYLLNFGNALRTRFERTSESRDLDQAYEVFREGAELLTATPARRLTAAWGWGQCAQLAGASSSALAGYEAAIELLPLVAWHGLGQSTREYHLQEWAGMASEAAAAAIAAGQLTQAVEWLEAGRSMLWTQALHLRQDLTALQERAPSLAAVLEKCRAVLNTSPVTVAFGSDADTEVIQVKNAEQQMLEQRRQAAREWDAAVEQIRQIAGFEHFLRTIPFTGLRSAAVQGPVIIVNISPASSQALIITSATDLVSDPAVTVVNLPAAPTSAVIEQAGILLRGVHRAPDPATNWQTRENDRHAAFNVLAWCWRAITEPVLATLGHTHTPAGSAEEWPRVWWCPTGPATLLPLHAAGRHPRTTVQHAAMGEAAALADTVAGRVISSYTPTLTALIRARAQRIPDSARQLAVGVPDAPSYKPGTDPLPGVCAELNALDSYLPAPEHATRLIGSAATRQAVLQALPDHSWLHLSCHGAQDRVNASESAFFLHDQPLTLADLAALDLREADLAYLAACQTATGDLRLPDEALHLAGALRLMGYRHVLATLWNISDVVAPAMAETIYGHLLHPDPAHPSPADQPDASRAPSAMHHAVTHLRQAYPGEPLLWAPYIHLGP